MSFSFLSDAFPDYNEPNPSASITLREDFNVPISTPTAVKSNSQDTDLLAENFTDYNLPIKKTKDTPQPFDHTSDYFKLVTADWDAKEQEKHVSPAKPQTGTGCMQVADHLDQCADCRMRLEQIFRKLLGKPLQIPIVETSKQQHLGKTSGSLDLILLLLMGIFIVFVLDAIVKLTKYFKR